MNDETPKMYTIQMIEEFLNNSEAYEGYLKANPNEKDNLSKVTLEYFNNMEKYGYNFMPEQIEKLKKITGKDLQELDNIVSIIPIDTLKRILEDPNEFKKFADLGTNAQIFRSTAPKEEYVKKLIELYELLNKSGSIYTMPRDEVEYLRTYLKLSALHFDESQETAKEIMFALLPTIMQKDCEATIPSMIFEMLAKYIKPNSEQNHLINEYVKSIKILIPNAAELTVNDLEKYAQRFNIKEIKMQNNTNFSDKGDRSTYKPYDVQTYIMCRQKIDEIISRIDMKKGYGTSEYQRNIFGQIVKILADEISYDMEAVNEKREEKVDTSRNMEGGLLEGQCVCAGYAEILRNVCACVNIESKYVVGYAEDAEHRITSGHAWNKVKLDGNWYNTDLTWDRDAIVDGNSTRYTLKSDSEFSHDAYKAFNCQSIQCNVSVPNSRVQEYIGAEARPEMGDVANKGIEVDSTIQKISNKIGITYSELNEVYSDFIENIKNKDSKEEER